MTAIEQAKRIKKYTKFFMIEYNFPCQHITELRSGTLLGALKECRKNRLDPYNTVSICAYSNDGYTPILCSQPYLGAHWEFYC